MLVLRSRNQKESDKPPPEVLKKFLRYEEMAAYTHEPSRAILAASAKNQPALDLNGGIFTKAFLAGYKAERITQRMALSRLISCLLIFNTRYLPRLLCTLINRRLDSGSFPPLEPGNFFL